PGVDEIEHACSQVCAIGHALLYVYLYKRSTINTFPQRGTAFFSFSFKGKVGMGMGFRGYPFRQPHPHPNPPLEGESFVGSLILSCQREKR
ncbi:MAG: hypothetical protein LBE75_07135, partial [Burkholderiales bacterium]|nr:hypothetical protein [Burkholderiales bacterium]